MLDINLLRLMRRRKDFNLLLPLVGIETLDDKPRALVAAFQKYYDKLPNHTDIDINVFAPAFERWYPKLKEETKAEFKGIMRNVWAKDADDDVRANLVNEFAELKLMTELANYAERYSLGDLPDAHMLVQRAHDEFRLRTGIKSNTYIDEDLGSILQDEFDEAGTDWRLKCLRDSLRGLRGGDALIIAARPDRGKTSFLASETTHMAPQLPSNRNVLWLNNEGPGRRIIPRIYQAALDLSMSGLKQAYHEGTAVGRFEEIMGRIDKFRVFDIHGKNNYQVEQIIDQNEPGIVIFDMIDNIKGFGDAPRTDLVLEHMYQWARETAVKYDFASLATSQISNDGDGMQFPTMGMLKDSKTGKQGACDAIIMIGATNDPGYASSRYIGVPKNKLRRVDGKSDPREEVQFDALHSRYRDIQDGA